MAEWGVVGVIVVLVGLFAAIAGPIIRLNTTIAKLDGSVEALRRDLGALTTRNSETHDRIFKRLDAADETLGDHETRITVLEKKA